MGARITLLHFSEIARRLTLGVVELGMMKWKRILSFVAILFLLTGLAAFPFGFIRGYCQARTRQVPVWMDGAQAMAVPFAAIVVFSILAWVQKTRTFIHCFLVGLFSWLLSFPINVLLFHQPFNQWATDIGVMIITVGIGAGVGIGLKHLLLSRRNANGAPHQSPGDESLKVVL